MTLDASTPSINLNAKIIVSTKLKDNTAKKSLLKNLRLRSLLLLPHRHKGVINFKADLLTIYKVITPAKKSPKMKITTNTK